MENIRLSPHACPRDKAVNVEMNIGASQLIRSISNQLSKTKTPTTSPMIKIASKNPKNAFIINYLLSLSYVYIIPKIFCFVKCGFPIFCYFFVNFLEVRTFCFLNHPTFNFIFKIIKLSIFNYFARCSNGEYFKVAIGEINKNDIIIII